MLTDARAPTLAAYVLFAIVGALLADPRHLQSALCFLLLLNATSPHSLLLRQVDPALLASPSSLTGRPLLRPQAGEARSAGSCGLSRGSEARASPSSLTEKQRVLVGLAEEARHETSLGDSILRRVYGFEAQKSYQVDSSFGKTFARKD